MLIISLFFRRSPAALDNHRHYAALHGYRHVYVEAADIYESPSAQWLFRYETLLSPSFGFSSSRDPRQRWVSAIF
ncbi:hypothetical protein [Caballeronia sp. S22]|uniref:hypothetical protein n=1 Tax=Caballeronia sp. S22 TaxID=3137182 RepID=UPI0035313261